MKIIKFLSEKLRSFYNWPSRWLKIHQFRKVDKAIMNLSEDQLQKFLKTGEAQLDIGGKSIEITPLRDTVLNKIKEACEKEGYVYRKEIVDYFRGSYGLLCSRAARKEVSQLINDGIISQEQSGESTILKLN